MRERIDNRRLGVEGRKFVLFTNDLPHAAPVLNFLMYGVQTSWL